MWKITNGGKVPDVIKLVIKFFKGQIFTCGQKPAVSADNKCSALLKTLTTSSKCLSQSPALQKTWLF